MAIERFCGCGAPLPTRETGRGRQQVFCEECKRKRRNASRRRYYHSYAEASMKARKAASARYHKRRLAAIEAAPDWMEGD